MQGIDKQFRSRPRRRRRGFGLIYVVVTMTAMTAFVSLSVDYARVVMAKTQLQRVADAAALYGAQGVESGYAVSNAQAVAAQEVVDTYSPAGTPFSLQAADVVTGNWSNGTFTANGSPTNAVQVTAVCSAARGTAIPLMFARILGQQSCDIHATSIAMCADNPPGGFVGYNGVTVKNNTSIASYNSAVTTSPSSLNQNYNGAVGSNAVIYAKNNDTVSGRVLLGPSGSMSGFAASGGTTIQASPLAIPSVPAWSPGTNPNNTPTTYSVSSDTTLPGGTYWFDSLSVTATLTFSGPAVIYVDGDVTLSGSLLAYNNVPLNLTIYGYGSHQFGDDSGSANNAVLCAAVFAPTFDFVEKNNLTYYGRGFFNTITCKNNASLYYDEGFGAAIGGTSVSLQK